MTTQVRQVAANETAAQTLAREREYDAAALREEMFEPFSHRTDRGDSSGLGLSIARATVEAHVCSLEYHEGRGGEQHRFVVSLPQPA